MNKLRPVAVVDARTYRIACRRVDDLLEIGETTRAHFAVTSIREWLRSEARTGSHRRRVKRAAQLEQWELRAAEIAREVFR